MIGGFCLSGLCFGTDIFTGSFDRQPYNIGCDSGFAKYEADGFATYAAEFRDGQSPLCGQGVMFYEQENRLVRKVDSFTFDPSQPTGLHSGIESLDTEPKKLQFRLPDFVLQNGQPSESLQGNDGNDLMMVQVSELMHDTSSPPFVTPAIPSPTASTEPYPTRFASAGIQYESPIYPNPMSVTQSCPVQQYPPVTVDTSYYYQPISTMAPITSSHLMSVNPMPDVTPPAVHIPSPAPSDTPWSSGNNTGYDAPAMHSLADQSRQDNNTVRVAMRRPDDGIDNISIDSGDLYITRDQLDEILKTHERSWKKDGIRKGPFTFTPYGYINVNTSYETNRTVMGDFALYSRSPDLDGGGHSGFHIDPKSSRLGMKVDGPNLPWQCYCLKTSAVFEIDFQGANYAGTRNRGAVMMRRAFVDFTHSDTRLLIGQEWDIVSPLVPQSLNYVPGSFVGNVGYRRAQIRLERTRKWDRDFSTIWQIALCDNVPADYLTDGNVNVANSGWPQIQGRFATTFGHNPYADCKPYTVGISGHIGEMTHDYKYTIPNINHRRHETWSANLDVEIPLTTRLQLTSELYTGTNMSPVLAGIGQGVDLYSPGSNVLDPRSAGAYGGWVNLNFKMTKKFQMNAGYSIERMKDIIASGFDGTARDKNQMLFLNGIYNWSDNFLTGLEVSQWRTDWHRYDVTTGTISTLSPGKTTRIELLTRYSF